MTTYFIEIAAINCAARLSGVELAGDYAIYGTLKRFRGKKLGEVDAIEGMEDMQDRAESFRYGLRCGKILARYTDSLMPEQRLACEAKIMRVFLAPEIADDNSVTAEDKKMALRAVIRSLTKRAQIRTHTTKPGYEDINTWLDSYDEMQRDYSQSLDKFIDAVVAPDDDAVQISDKFFSEDDSFVKLALSGESIGMNEALSTQPLCTFGEILREIVVDK